MRRRFAAPALFALVAPLAQLPPTQVELREKVELAAEDGVDADELKSLAREAFALAHGASSRADYWSALTLVAELCASAPPAEARAVRARALRSLAEHDSDTLRWSSLLTVRFLPPLAAIPRADWSAELALYERTLDELVETAANERVRVELMHARAFGRAFVNRYWDWLSEPQRLEAIERLRALERDFGELPVPGASDPALDTVGHRARAHLHELEHLHFGALAPSTSGQDLAGQPLDLADYAGKIVVLDFWTTFCQPCLALVPGIRDLMGDLADEPVVYIGVNGDPDRAAGLATATRVGMTWRNLWDGPEGSDGPAARAWNVAAVGWPSVFVLDGRGRIRFKLYGKQQVDAELAAAIRTLLAQR